MTQMPVSVALGGGVDLISPAISKNPAHLIGGENYEPRPEGYRRMNGVERYDGHIPPSRESYWVVDYEAGRTEPELGQAVTGATSGATGILMAINPEAGTFQGGDATGNIVIRSLTGAFQSGERLDVQTGTPFGFALAASGSVLHGAATDELDGIYHRQAMMEAREQIGPVPGSGIVRGVWRYKDVTYAFRDNEAADACCMWRESANGWEAVALGHTLAFHGGVRVPEGGMVVTGAVSGAEATVRQVVIQSGDWPTEDASGYMSIDRVTGIFVEGETITVPEGEDGASVDCATASAGLEENRLEPGGYFEFDNYAFLATSSSLRMYGCDGVSDAFEFDGTSFIWIRPRGKTDKPKYIGGNTNHLMLTYPGGVVTVSSIGLPLQYISTTGAAEFGLGDECTGLVTEYRGTAVIYGRNRTAILFGSSAADFVLKIISHEAGAYDRTAQQLVQAVSVDNRGIKGVQAVQDYGDFTLGTMSEKIRPWLDRKKRGREVPHVTASQRVRSKDQYRVFYSDGTALIMSLAKPAPEFLFFNYGFVVRRAVSVEDPDGNERLFVTSDDGFVYEADAGTSLDGAPMLSFVRFAFDHQGAPTQNKRYARIIFEADIEQSATLYVSASYDFGVSAADTHEQFFVVTGGGGFWNDLVWNQFYWDAAITGLVEAHIAGFGQNISIVVASESAHEQPHVLQARTIHYSPRGMKR